MMRAEKTGKYGTTIVEYTALGDIPLAEYYAALCEHRDHLQAALCPIEELIVTAEKLMKVFP